MKKLVFLGMCFAMAFNSFAQTPKSPFTSSKFEQLREEFPTANTYRTASGAPGYEYWQQKADYKIKVELDDEKQWVKGAETITYYNNSPEDLNYLWLQLDQNAFDKSGDVYKVRNFSIGDQSGGVYSLLNWMRSMESNGGYQILSVKDANGKALKFTINQTMMRVDLPAALKAKGGTVSFSVEWSFYVPDQIKFGGRGGYEYFENDKNYLYEMAQWFPRMAVYNDVTGWQHKQFLGAGEFALTFGDYEVAITVPADHVVASTGELQNAKEVLTSEQLSRWEKAKTSTVPVVIVTQEEAVKAEQTKVKNTKTWVYKAQNVRDFAWASSRKFIWDAMQIQIGANKVWAMSYYPKEGNPLWGQYSTQVVAHTLRVYSEHTIDYPYPVAISVHGPVFGMEYPMICFNGGRPLADGTIPENTRNAMVSVIIHEVGHNFFPMIINNDERQWNWMDEGLNTFCQYLAECEIPKQEWAKKDYPEKYPSRRGPAANIINYMKLDPKFLVPIMTTSDLIPGNQLGNNAYAKPCTALNILRETIMGKELFDHAFKQYAQRWAFKHPEPADFFRTMEDASAVDLDWYWRGWFYGTEPVEISLESVKLLKISNDKPSASSKQDDFFEIQTIATSGLAELFKNMKVSTEEQKMMTDASNNFYVLHFKNNGGLVMPLIIQINYKDGTNEIQRVPAEIWRTNPEEVRKVVLAKKEVASFVFDPLLETADIDVENNSIPRKNGATKFQEFKSGN